MARLLKRSSNASSGMPFQTRCLLSGTARASAVFRVSKQFHHIAHTIYYSRPPRIHVTGDRHVCELMCRPTFWTKGDGSSRLPLIRFETIELHLHPEISFLHYDCDTREVIEHMTSNHHSQGILAEARMLAHSHQGPQNIQTGQQRPDRAHNKVS